MVAALSMWAACFPVAILFDVSAALPSWQVMQVALCPQATLLLGAANDVVLVPCEWQYVEPQVRAEPS
jgi:hypothetical protein